MAVTSPAARMRGFSSPATTAYAVVGSVHFGGIWPTQSAASVAIVHGVVAVDAARRVVAHGAEEAAVELRLDAVERVGR